MATGFNKLTFTDLQMIAENVTPLELEKLCIVNRKFQGACNNPNFWKLLVKGSIPEGIGVSELKKLYYTEYIDKIDRQIRELKTLETADRKHISRVIKDLEKESNELWHPRYKEYVNGLQREIMNLKHRSVEISVSYSTDVLLLGELKKKLAKRVHGIDARVIHIVSVKITDGVLRGYIRKEGNLSSISSDIGRPVKPDDLILVSSYPYGSPELGIFIYSEGGMDKYQIVSFPEIPPKLYQRGETLGIPRERLNSIYFGVQN